IDGFSTDDDEVPTKEVSQELVEEVSEEVDEVKPRKVVDDMLRQRCTLGEEHQYHIDKMQNYLKNDIVWESKKERLSLPTLQKPALVYQIPFPDDDNEERTSRWVKKHIKKFNPYARYSVEHWNNRWAMQFYIRMQHEQGNLIKEVYFRSQIVEVIRTLFELGHEHKFITEIIMRRANGRIDPITESDYKNLNKNNIKDMYLLCINDKLGVEICRMIYKNSKKEKRVMVHNEIHKFCDATVKRVLEGLEKYNKDVKYGYANPRSSKDHAELLRYYEKHIEERLKYRDHTRCWEMYVNGRPLGSRRERPE
ncbi:hypothetical protein Tco_1306522, partial [Tanacetum coccineum]